MATLKILIVGPYLTEKGGVSSFMSQLREYLTLIGQDYRYFSVGRRRIFAYQIVFPLYFLLDYCRYIMLLRRYNPAVVHHNPSFGYKSLIRDLIYTTTAKVFHSKAVFFIHGWSDRTFADLVNARVAPCVLRSILSLPDKIIVLSDTFKRKLHNIGLPDSVIDVFPMMINRANFVPGYTGSIDVAKKHVLFMANFFTDKGVYDVIRAVPLVSSALQGRNAVEFVLAGDGPELQDAIDLVKTMGIADKVRFTGYVTGRDKFALYNAAAMFVLPTSHGEGFPTVIAEAMAAGLPVIATGVGAIPEVIEHGVNGLIISKPDEKELADAIVWLLKRPKLMKKMGRINREKAKNYDVSVVCKRLVELYDEVIASKT